jgi:hypothetical protein
MTTGGGSKETGMEADWVREFPGAITLGDENGVILSLNAKAEAVFAADGGAALVGTSVLDCHPEPARTKLREMMEARRTNVYTIEKNGVKKLIYQAPWFQGGVYKGFIELALEVPPEMPHFVRKG